jgi:hypothetical protein
MSNRKYLIHDIRIISEVTGGSDAVVPTDMLSIDQYLTDVCNGNFTYDLQGTAIRELIVEVDESKEVTPKENGSIWAPIINVFSYSELTADENNPGRYIRKKISDSYFGENVLSDPDEDLDMDRRWGSD